MKEIEKLLIWRDRRVDSQYKFAFMLTITLGFITHMYCFTNNLLTHDSLHSFYQPQRLVGSGRWLLEFVCSISSNFDLHWFNGIISLLWISLYVCMIISVYKITNRVSIFLIALVAVTFPAVTSTFAFMYTADGYFLGLFLSGLSVYYFVKEGKKNLILAICFAAFSMGIYQAYISSVMVMLIIYLVIELLRANAVKQKIIRFVVGGIGIAVLYVVILKLCLFINHTSLTSYQGINQVGKISSFERILYDFLQCYKLFLSRMLYGFSTQRNVFHMFSCAIIVICTFIMIVLIILSKKLSIKRGFAVVCLLGTLPCAIYILCFASEGVMYHSLMIMSWELLWMIPVIIGDCVGVDCRKQKWTEIICFFVVLFNVIGFAILDNIAYLAMEVSYEKSYALTGRIFERIEALEVDGADRKKICVIGDIDQSKYLNEDLNNAVGGITGVHSDLFIVYGEHLVAMINRSFGQDYQYVSIKESGKSLDDLSDASIWPDDKSVYLEDGIIYVILQNVENIFF